MEMKIWETGDLTLCPSPVQVSVAIGRLPGQNN